MPQSSLTLGNGIKREPNERATVIVQRRSLCAARDIQPGKVIVSDDLIPLRPCPPEAFLPYETEIDRKNRQGRAEIRAIDCPRPRGMNSANPVSLAVIIGLQRGSHDCRRGWQCRAAGPVVVVNLTARATTPKTLARTAGATVLTLPGNQGYEGALSTGVQYAIDHGFAFTLTMDADGQHCWSQRLP